MLRKRLISWLLVLLAIAGCAAQPAAPTSRPIPTTRPDDQPAAAPTSQPIATTPPDDQPTAAGASSAAPADWQRSWLDGRPCAPPCLFGITPGTTTRDEAFELLSAAFPEVEPEELASFSGDDTMLDLNMEAEGEGATAYFYTAPARSSATPANMIVAFIAFAPDMASFREVIAAYGEPSHMLAQAIDSEYSGLYYRLDAVYMDRGLLVSFDIDGGKSPPELAPDLMAVAVAVFAPSEAGFNEGMRAYYDLPEASALLVPWQGFQPYATYCREARPDAKHKGCVSAQGDPAPDWRRDWLSGVPCAPPCILGITPGTLSQTATVDLLAQTFPDTQVDVLRKEGVAQGAIRWLADPADSESMVSAVFYQKPLKLYDVPLNTVISVRLGYLGVLPLDEVIAAYGEPSHVLALAQPSTPGRTFFIVMFAYLERGFSLSLDFRYDGEQPILERSMRVDNIHFFPPGVAGFEGAIGPGMPMPEVGALLVPWQGFVKFADYCSELANPEQPGRLACP